MSWRGMSEMSRELQRLRMRAEWEQEPEDLEIEDDQEGPEPPEREFTDRDQDYWERMAGL